MGVYGRTGVFAALALFATTATVAALPHGALKNAPVAIAASTAPCVPNPSRPGVLPSPPAIDANTQTKFTLYVRQGAATAKGNNYCYVTSPNGDASYVEAPTIHIRRGGTFTMTLINQIPSPSPNPSIGPTPVPTPPNAIIKTPDKCAWLPDDGPMPTPYPAMTPPGYFNHARVPVHEMPPWMLENDTNFHTHGWHVSPYVDNVYKSLVWSPTPNTCVYAFSVRASQPPGTYWYHAHLHGLSDAQVGGGLAGALIVDGDTPPGGTAPVVLLIKNSPNAQGAGVTSHLTLPGMADGMTMRSPMSGRPATRIHYATIDAQAKRGAVKALAAAPAGSPIPFSAFSPPPWKSGIPWPSPAPSYCKALPQSAAGVGDPMVVNGALVPAVLAGRPVPAVGPAVSQTIGTLRRYRILNAASDSYVNVQTVADDATVVPLQVAARDGVPVNWDFTSSKIDPSRPAFVVEPNVYVPPSGRVDIMVRETGRPLTIVSAAGTPNHRSADGTPFCNGYFGAALPRRNILRINPFVGPNQSRTLAATAATNPVQQRTVRSAAATFVANDLPKVTKSRAITFTMYPEDGWNWNVTQTGVADGPNPPPALKALPFNERPFWLAGRTPVNPAYPYIPWVQVHQNDVEQWYLYNATGEIHAFHIHQLTFVALKSPFESTNPYQQVFLDTIGLPAGQLTNPQTPPQNSLPLITPSLTKILIDFRHVDPGVFVFHCHMLFHEDHGMMGVVEVLPPVTAR
ncbi:MAG: multicopper oxidase, type 2 [Candidatus Eremiobacteraeota bacterium]|nr:multicopper oxidase, type 2 [Candidatus Eremiobacteraeota bacterium]